MKIISFPKRPYTEPTEVIYQGLPLTKDEWAVIVTNQDPQADQEVIDSSWAEVVSMWRRGALPDQPPAPAPIPLNVPDGPSYKRQALAG